MRTKKVLSKLHKIDFNGDEATNFLSKYPDVLNDGTTVIIENFGKARDSVLLVEKCGERYYTCRFSNNKEKQIVKTSILSSTNLEELLNSAFFGLVYSLDEEIEFKKIRLNNFKYAFKILTDAQKIKIHNLFCDYTMNTYKISVNVADSKNYYRHFGKNSIEPVKRTDLEKILYKEEIIKELLKNEGFTEKVLREFDGTEFAFTLERCLV